MKRNKNESNTNSTMDAAMNNSCQAYERMTGRVKLLVAVLAGLVLAVSNFSLSQSIANYNHQTPIAGPTSIIYSSIASTGSSMPAWRNDTTGNSTEDDNRSYQVPIGFDFWYDGVRYTQFSVSTNGFMDLSSATYDGGPNSRPYGPYDQDISDNYLGGTALCIGPLYYDLTTQGEVNPLGNSIKYLVTGAAPTRILTVEWINMSEWPNHTSSTNFQAKLHESTGIIDFVYGTMNPGSGFTWSYSLGINGPVLNATPTAAQLLLAQNGPPTTFNSTVQNSLSTLPTSNTMLRFTPDTASASPSNLTFPGASITQTSMQLSWNDNANNEVGYVIYRSDDGGATYNFIHQLAANTTSSNETGLLAGTIYYWKIYAVTEGSLGTVLQGSQSTSPAPNVISSQSGLWNTGSTWVGGVVPASTANVTIADGHTVTIDGNITANSITVGQGTSGILLIGNSATARTVTVNGTITVNAGGSFTPNTSFTQTGHLINATGDIINGGTFDMSPNANSRAAVNFNRGGPQNIQGSGAKTQFYLMTLNMGSTNSNILDVSATNFSAATSNFLTITNGTFRLSTGATITPFSGNGTIPASGGLWLYSNSPNVTITDSLTVSGSLKVSSGTLTVGSVANECLISNGGTFTFEGGTTNIAGRFEPLNNYTITNFTMSGGIFNVPTVAAGSTSTTLAPFTMNVSGSYFEMTGGTIVVKQAGGANLGFLNTGSASYAVTGGTVQIGDASTPAGQTIQVNSVTPVYNLTVAGTSATTTAQLATNSLTVKNNLTINSTNVLDANSLNVTVLGNWSDAGSFTPGTGTVTFNGSTAQSITKTSSAEAFYKLAINNNTSVSLSASTSAVVADSFQIAQGTFSIGANTLTLDSAVTSSGTLSVSSTGTVNYNQTSAGQAVLATSYGNLTFSNFTKILPSSGTVGIAGTFTPGTAAGHTITGSTVDFNGSGSQTVSSFTFNNLNLSNSGTKTLASGADTVQGTLTIASGVTLADAGVSMRVFKNIVNNGTHSGTGNITLIGGSAAHSLSGLGSYTNLIMNDANGATLSNNLIVNGVLTFTNGIIATSSADTVIIASTGSVSRTNGHVNGNLEKHFSTGSNVTQVFEIGDASTYARDSVTFASVTTGGNLTSSVTAGDNPNIATSGVDPNHSVNRYWTISNGGIAFTTYNATFNFVAGDIDAGSTTGTFIVAKLDAAWSLPTVGTKTGTSTQATGIGSIYASGSSFVIGNVATTATNSYRSVATGNWSSTSTWQTYNGTSWVAAAAAPDSTKQNITLQSPYTVTVTASTNADQLEVQAGATLVINSGQTFTLHDGAGTDLTLEGTLTNSGTITQGTATAIVSSGGLYNHNTNNTANLKATWDPNSTCQFSGVTNGTPANFAQTFGHFTWNCPSQTATIGIAGVLTTIAGNFTMTSTGTGELDLAATQSQTTTVGGNYSQTGGTFGLSTGTGGAPTFSIAGSVSISGGTLRMKGSAAGGNISGVSTMNVGGNFSFTSGTISRNSTNTGGKGSIVFKGTSIQTYASGGTIATTDSIGFTVNSGATLYVGTSTIVGGGTFTLSSGAALGIGSASGITASGATGNIQTTGRTYNTGSNYIYNGVALQSTGNGLPATVNKLTINNSSGANLTNSVQTDSLYLTAGALNVNAAVTLTINNLLIVSSGSLTSAATGTVNYSKPSNIQNLIVGSYGNLTFSNFSKIFPSSGIVSIAGTFTQGTGTGHVFTGSTVSFNGTASQVIPAFSYNNLMTSNGWKGIAGATTVLGNLTLTSGVLSDSSFVLTVNGNIVNSGVHKSGAGEIYLNGGASAHLVSGGGTFANIELNDGSGITITGSMYIGGILTLTRGIITTGNDTVVIIPGGNVNRAVTGLARHVYGNMKRYFASGSPISETFQIGDASNYAPIDMTFASVSVAGYVVASTVGSSHPSMKISAIDQTNDANRYWTVKNLSVTFTTYDLNLNFVSGDLTPTANTGYFFIRRYSSPLWYGTNTTVRTASSTESMGLGPTEFGDFAVGQLQSYFRWTGVAGDTKWSTAGNWSFNSVPTSMNDVVLDTNAVINSINATDSCRSLTINNSALQLSVTTGALSVSGNLTMSAGILNTQSVFPTVTGTVSISGGKIGFNGTGAQSIPAYSYYDLSVSGAHTSNNITLASGTISVADSFITAATFGTGTWVNTGNTFVYAGTAGQLVGAIRYNNLSLVNARGANNITFSNADTLHIAGTLTTSATFNSGSGYILTGTMFDFTGTGSQTIPSWPYNSLRISGARGTNTVTFSTADTVHVASVFSPVATFSGTGGYQSTGTIFEYNGSSTQNIAAFTYNNLVLSNGSISAKTFTGTDSIKGNLVINNGATASGASANVVLFGNWTNSGSFSASTSTVEFGGVPSTAVIGATTFYTLNINKHDSATAITLNNNINVGTLNMMMGTMQTGSNSVTITTTRTGNALILGTVTRTQSFALSTPYAFEGPNTLITFTSGSVPSSVTVAVTQTTPASPTMVPVNRSVTITNTGGSFTATLRLHYENIETNNLNETGLKLWEYTGGAWVNMGATSRDTVNNYVEETGIPSFSPSWAIGASASSKTVVDVNGGVANAGDTLAYTVTIVNPYLISKPSVNVSDGLPANFIFVPGSISNSGSISGQALSGKNLEGGTITWPSFSLGGGASLTRTFQLCSDSAISSSQTITNTAQINFGGGSVEYVSVPITLTNVPNIIVTNSVSKTSPIPGDTLVYTVTFANKGTSVATSVVMTNASPNNTTFSPNGYGVGMGVLLDGSPMTNASGDDPVTVASGTITVTIGNMIPGVIHTVKFKTVVN